MTGLVVGDPKPREGRMPPGGPRSKELAHMLALQVTETAPKSNRWHRPDCGHVLATDTTLPAADSQKSRRRSAVSFGGWLGRS